MPRKPVIPSADTLDELHRRIADRPPVRPPSAYPPVPPSADAVHVYVTGVVAAGTVWAGRVVARTSDAAPWDVLGSADVCLADLAGGELVVNGVYPALPSGFRDGVPLFWTRTARVPAAYSCGRTPVFSAGGPVGSLAGYALTTPDSVEALPNSTVTLTAPVPGWAWLCRAEVSASVPSDTGGAGPGGVTERGAMVQARLQLNGVDLTPDGEMVVVTGSNGTTSDGHTGVFGSLYNSVSWTEVVASAGVVRVVAWAKLWSPSGNGGGLDWPDADPAVTRWRLTCVLIPHSVVP